ncbi:MAG: hypothetical protein ACRDBQ_18850 [Shewanella sp.]
MQILTSENKTIRCKLRPDGELREHGTGELIRLLLRTNTKVDNEVDEVVTTCFGIDSTGLLNYAVSGFVRGKHMRLLCLYNSPRVKADVIDIPALKAKLGVEYITYRFGPEDNRALENELNGTVTKTPIVVLDITKRKKLSDKYCATSELSVTESIEVAKFVASTGNGWLLKEANVGVSNIVFYRNESGWVAYGCGMPSVNGMELTDWYLSPELSEKERGKVIRNIARKLWAVNERIAFTLRMNLGPKAPVVPVSFVCPEEFIEHYKIDKCFKVIFTTDSYTF